MALVSKILEATLTAGSTTVTFTDSDIPNSLIRVYSSNSDIIPESRILSGNTLTVIYAAQTVNIDVAVEIVKQGLDIVDNVLSEDTDKALSAKQGYLLSAAIGDVSDNLSTLTETVNNLDIPDNITDLDDINVTSIQNGQVLVWDSVTEKFINQTPVNSFLVPDFTNQIYDSGNITSNYSSFSYELTQNGWLCATIRGGGLGSTAIVYVNGASVIGSDNTKNITFPPFFAKAGDIITLRNVNDALYRIFLYGSR